MDDLGKFNIPFCCLGQKSQLSQTVGLKMSTVDFEGGKSMSTYFTSLQLLRAYVVCLVLACVWTDFLRNSRVSKSATWSTMTLKAQPYQAKQNPDGFKSKKENLDSNYVSEKNEEKDEEYKDSGQLETG